MCVFMSGYLMHILCIYAGAPPWDVRLRMRLFAGESEQEDRRQLPRRVPSHRIAEEVGPRVQVRKANRIHTAHATRMQKSLSVI